MILLLLVSCWHLTAAQQHSKGFSPGWADVACCTVEMAFGKQERGGWWDGISLGFEGVGRDQSCFPVLSRYRLIDPQKDKQQAVSTASPHIKSLICAAYSSFFCLQPSGSYTLTFAGTLYIRRKTWIPNLTGAGLARCFKLNHVSTMMSCDNQPA